MGISANTQGYHYILEAISILKGQKIHINAISLYEMINKKLNTKSVSAVERAIRYAIEILWKNKSILTNVYSECPVNSAFLYNLVFNLDIFLEI